MEELHPRLAVDLGTTWTAASRVADSGVEAVPLGSGHPLMPSVVARDGEQFVVGEQAERLLDLRPESGAREVKRRFGDTTPVVIDGQPFGADALMAEILRAVARVAYPGGWSAVDVVLTHPANWGAYKLELLTNIGQQAGFRQVVLQSEPVAAATHFVETGRVNGGDVVAVYDFGGGTFDAAVVRVGDDASVLGTPQGLERLGGIDVDQMVFAHVAASLDGTLSQLDSTDPDVRRGVARVRAECTKAKEALSSDSDAMIAVSLPTITTKVRITRPELESILRQRIDETLATLDRAIASAGMTADDLAAVALIGGSSQIPLVAERVRAHVGRPTLFGNDPKLVVAFGALEGALRSSRSAPTSAPAAANPDELAEETPSGAVSPEVAAAAAAAASAERDTTNEVTATVTSDATAVAQRAPGASTGATVSTPAAGGSRAPAPPPPKPVESRAGRIAGGVAGAAAAVAGGVVFHEQLAAATGIDPQVAGDVFSDVAATAAAAASAAGSAATLRGGDDTGDDANLDDGLDDGLDDVDTQRSNVPAGATDDSMDAFDDNPLNEPATVDLVGGAGDGDAVTGGVRDAFTAEVQAAAAEPAAPVATPEPAFAGNAAPPIDDFSSVVGPPSDPPDTLGPKVGFSAPSNRPTTHQADPDGPVSSQRAQPPANPTATAAPPHSPAPPTVAPAQAVPQPAAAAAADAHGAVVDASTATAGPNDGSIDDDSSTPPQHDDGNADNAGFDAARARLLDRVAHLDPPAGASDQQVADLKADLQQMIDRFEPRPGESTDQALAALRAEYDDRVRDFTQDQKIDALIQEERRDNARESIDHADDGSTLPTTDSTSGQDVATAIDDTATADAPSGAGAGDEPTTSTPPSDMAADPTAPTETEVAAPPAYAEPTPIFHPDRSADKYFADRATEILKTMDQERRDTFQPGQMVRPPEQAQFYVQQQAHISELQELVNQQAEIARATDGGMVSSQAIDQVNKFVDQLVTQANNEVTKVQSWAHYRTGAQDPVVPTLQLVNPGVVMPPVQDPNSAAAAYNPQEPTAPNDPGPPGGIPNPEETATLEDDDPSYSYALIAQQVSAVNVALAEQARVAGLDFKPVEIPLDPNSGAPDLAAINAMVADQVSKNNVALFASAAASGTALAKVDVPTISLPNWTTDQQSDDLPGNAGAMGEDGPDSSAAAPDAPNAGVPDEYYSVLAQVSAVNQALSQAAVNAVGMPVNFPPVQVPLDPATGLPDMETLNGVIANQVINANQIIMQQAAAWNRPVVSMPVPIPTITLPDVAPADAGGAAAAEADPGGAGALGESGPPDDGPDMFQVVSDQVAAMNAALAAQAQAAGVGFTPIQVPLDPAGAAPDLDQINALITSQMTAANTQITTQAAAMGRPATAVPIQTIALPEETTAGADDGTKDAAVQAPSGAAMDAAATPNAADQATVGAADDATYGPAETAAYQGAAATNEPVPAAPTQSGGAADAGASGTAAQSAAASPNTANQATFGAADDATYGPAESAAYQGAAATNEPVPVAPTQSGGAADAAAGTAGAANVAAGQQPGATSADAGGLDDPFDAQEPSSQGSAQGVGGAGAPTTESALQDVALAQAQNVPGIGQPVTQVLRLGQEALDQLAGPSQPSGGGASMAPDAQFDGGPGTAEGPVDSGLPSLPDPADVPDILGHVDASNTMQAPDGATDDIELPTIPDITPADVPAPPPPPDMPDLDLPEIPSVPDVPAIPVIAVPDLPDLPDLPAVPDFSSDGPSFGDDIGSDVSPNDPTTTDF